MRYAITRTKVGFKGEGQLFIAFEITPEEDFLPVSDRPWAQGGYTLAPDGKAKLLSATWSHYPEEMEATERELQCTVESRACTELALLLLACGQVELTCTGDDCPEVKLPLAGLRRRSITKQLSNSDA